MKSFFIKNLISNSNSVSSRRIIAVALLPFYMGAIVCGIILAFLTSDFRFFLVSIIAAGIPIMIAYFLLTWEHVISISKRIDFFQEQENENTNEEL